MVSVRATGAERDRSLPGDAMIAEPVAIVMHAITIGARPPSVWSWLVQMGSGRAGWYSYDRVDNDGHPSEDRIVAALQHITKGDVLPSLPGETSSFVVAAVDPARSLLLAVANPGGGVLVTWEFFLEPLPAGTRLLVRGRVDADWPGDKGGDPRPKDSPRRPIEIVYAVLARLPRWIMSPAARLGHHVMQARQLRGIKRRAEGSTEAPGGSDPAPRGRLAWSAIALEVFLGVGALGGGAALMLGPRGEVLPLPVSALAGSPFTSYLVPGAVLFFVIGLGPLVAAVLAWRRHGWAPFAATAVGAALLTWMAVEIAIVGYTNAPPLQAIYLAVGAAILLVGIRWQRQARRAGSQTPF